MPHITAWYFASKHHDVKLRSTVSWSSQIRTLLAFVFCQWFLLRRQKFRTHLFEIQSSKVLPLKSGIGQNLLPGVSFFLTTFYLPGAFTFIFFQNLSRVFPVLAVANARSCVVPQNKTDHPTRCHRRLMQVLVLIAYGIKDRLPNMCYCVSWWWVGDIVAVW